MGTSATVSAMEVRQSFGALLNRVQYAGERITVERQGTPVAAMIGLADLRRLEALEADRELELFQLAQRAFAADQPAVLTGAEFVAAVEQARGESLDLTAYV